MAYRKIIDCVLDTNSTDMYEKCIQLEIILETNDFSSDIFKTSINQLLNELDKIDVETRGLDVLLKADNLSKKYGANKFSLDNVSLELKPGEVWGLVGENGNGKTTLLRILAKELKFDSGEISFFNEINSLKNYDQRTKLVYIPQRTPKWHGPLKDNLKYVAAHYGFKGRENELLVNMMIIRFGLWKFRNHKWSELSSGYKMRFELARTFLRKPNILLIDEPLANLDVVAQQLVLEDLKNLTRSCSNPLGIILSSQQLFEVEKISDHILFLKQGKPTQLSSLKDNNQNTIIELDIDCQKIELENLLASINMESIVYNGSHFELTLNEEDGMKKVMQLISHSKHNILYIRDISKSTKRLFIKK